MADRKSLPGKFVWFELVTGEPKKAQGFYAEVLGWRTQAFPMGPASYDMIYAGDTMIGGYASPRREGTPSHWIAYVSVDDVDAAAKRVTANGGKIVEPPSDIPTVGRRARIADPQGAEICLFKNTTGDPPDQPKAPQGWFFWNELHTTDPAKALAFYEAVIGYSHEDLKSPAGTYHVLSHGGVGRGGVSSYLSPGASPHWLPYVSVDDVDATLARAKRLGAKIPMNAEDIPDIGRFGILQDPTGAVLAIMKPLPRAKEG
jgi:predicted enzyme related to lactoylglutathione lyase